MRTLKLLHRWVGLVLALPMLLLALTGVGLMLVDPVNAWLAPTAPVSQGEPNDVPAIIAAARAAAPEGIAPTGYTAGADARAAASVDLGRPGERQAVRRLWIDPVTLKIIETVDHPGQFIGWLHQLHESLMISGYGRNIVGWSGLGLLLLGISGIPLWWPAPRRSGRWKPALGVNMRARGLRFQRELHGASGIWISVVLIVEAATGAALGFPQTMREVLTPGAAPMFQPAPATGAPRTGEARQGERPGGERPGGERGGMDIAAIVAGARGAVPNGQLAMLRLPAGPRNGFARVRPADGQGAMVMVQVDARGRVVSASGGSTGGSAGQAAMRWIHSIHEGEGLGPVWTVLCALGGLGLALLSVTGPIMWLLRTRNRRRMDRARAAALAGASLSTAAGAGE